MMIVLQTDSFDKYIAAHNQYTRCMFQQMLPGLNSSGGVSATQSSQLASVHENLFSKGGDFWYACPASAVRRPPSAVRSALLIESFPRETTMRDGKSVQKNGDPPSFRKS